MSPPAQRLCLRAAPHGDSVLSVAFSSAQSSFLLASGGEDCALLLHDLRCCSAESASTSTSTISSSTSAAAARSFFADPVAALAWQSEHVLYLGSGNQAHRVDTRKFGGSSGSGGENTASVVVGVFEDEVSSLSVSRDGRTLAVADDSGSVSLLDLSRAERLSGGAMGGEEAEVVSLASSVAALSVSDGQCLLPSRRLPRAHAGSLATSVAFRPGRAGESLVSGGCDCSLARWDCRSGRLVRRWQARGIAGGDEGGEEGAITGEGVEGTTATAATSRVFNPPFVHAVAVPSISAAKPWSGCVAAALGDGSVAVLDCEAKEETRHPRKREKKPPPSSLLSSLPAFSGILRVLRPEEGGHSAAATCVAFVGEGGGERGGSAPLVASGGDDGRLLFWRWARSAAGGEEGELGRQRQQQLPAAWEAALAPLRGLGSSAAAGGGGGGGSSVVVAAAATARDRHWKMQALAAGPSGSALVAAADTSLVVKVYRVE